MVYWRGNRLSEYTMMEGSPRQFNHAKQLDAFLPPHTQTVLRQAAALAQQHGWRLFLVGGTVRDLLLNRTAGDLDFTVEGDAIALADALANQIGGTVTRHDAFGTAAIAVADTLALDFVTARSEHYPAPASLPVVQPASLHEDLWRRDFTINAIAISLNTADYGMLYDPSGGFADLQARHIRVLHDQSFIDDPTRILRGVRLATRLDCSLEPHTYQLAQQAIANGMLQRTSPARLLHELLLVLDEPMPAMVFEQFARLGILVAIHPALQWQPEMHAWYAAAQQLHFASVEQRQLGVALLTWPLDIAGRTAFLNHFALDATTSRILRDIDHIQAQLPALSATTIAPSVLDRMLNDRAAMALQAAMIATDSACSTNIRFYLKALRPQVLALDGNDLQTMGLQPGPHFRVLLAGLRAAVLDGVVTTREEQIAWVRNQPKVV